MGKFPPASSSPCYSRFRQVARPEGGTPSPRRRSRDGRRPTAPGSAPYIGAVDRRVAPVDALPTRNRQRGKRVAECRRLYQTSPFRCPWPRRPRLPRSHYGRRSHAPAVSGARSLARAVRTRRIEARKTVARSRAMRRRRRSAPFPYASSPVRRLSRRQNRAREQSSSRPSPGGLPKGDESAQRFHALSFMARFRNLPTPRLAEALFADRLDLIVAFGAIDAIGNDPRQDENSDDEAAENAEIVVEGPIRLQKPPRSAKPS